MAQLLWLVSGILVCGILGVDSLQCYVCTNCTNPTDADLKTCVDPSSTTSTSTSSSTSLSSAATSSESPATDPPVDPENPSVDPENPSVDPENPSVDPENKSVDPENPSVDPENPSVDPENPSAGRRSKRSIIRLISNYDDECSCRNELGCECDDNNIFADRMMYADEYGPQACYKATVRVNNEDIVKRGCTPSTFNGTAACDVEEAKNLTKSCSTCSTDKCNGSDAVHYSVFTLAAFVTFMLFK